MRNVVVGLLLVGALGAAARGQSNTIDGLDGYMRRIDGLVVKGRQGTFPSGMNGLAFDANICNTGTVNITWKAAMESDHPFIAFMVAREMDGRFVQISDRSFVKHTFAATNSSDCDVCTDHSDSTRLAVGCSDTYSSGTNADRYWLAPPTELDPWLLEWDPIGSYFDRGDPAVPPPDDTDGLRSLTHAQANAMGPVKNRIQVSDADLNVAGATFYYFGEYLLRGEADALRGDTCATRQFIPTWNGTRWDIATQTGIQRGSLLRNWQGATLNSNRNGDDDGRVFLASMVTGPDVNGLYHYEYAMNNRDNGRAIGSLQIPICPGATITNAGFRDIDGDATNDWTLAVGAADVTWSTAANPVEYNTIYNFWFDSDVAPSAASKSLVSEFRSGPGLAAFTIDTDAPLGALLGTDLGFGKAGDNGLVPDLTICGGLLGGETGHLVTRYASPSAMAYLFISDTSAGLDYRGGRIVPYPPLAVDTFLTDPSGELIWTVDGVDDSFDLFVQVVMLDPDLDRSVSMTDAFEVSQ